MNYYIADLHFGHKNVLSFDNRGFIDIVSHDDALINNWNETVNIDDDVYLLGDVSWHNVTKTIELISQLNGKKHLIIGNHDKSFLKNKDFRGLFVTIDHYLEIEDKEHKVILCHYPIPCFNSHYYGAYHLYGHVHNSFEWNMMKNIQFQMKELYDKPCNMFNVGAMIDYMQYSPKTLEQIIIANS